MKKLLAILAIFLVSTFSSCDLLNDEPPYSLSGTQWESNELILELPGGLNIGVVYILEFTSFSNYTLSIYQGDDLYGDYTVGKYSYNRPHISLNGMECNMHGEATSYSNMELYDEAYDAYIQFYRY